MGIYISCVIVVLYIVVNLENNVKLNHILFVAGMVVSSFGWSSEADLQVQNYVSPSGDHTRQATSANASNGNFLALQDNIAYQGRVMYFCKDCLQGVQVYSECTCEAMHQNIRNLFNGTDITEEQRKISKYYAILTSSGYQHSDLEYIYRNVQDFLPEEDCDHIFVMPEKTSNLLPRSHESNMSPLIQYTDVIDGFGKQISYDDQEEKSALEELLARMTACFTIDQIETISDAYEGDKKICIYLSENTMLEKNADQPDFKLIHQEGKSANSVFKIEGVAEKFGPDFIVSLARINREMRANSERIILETKTENQRKRLLLDKNGRFPEKKSFLRSARKYAFSISGWVLMLFILDYYNFCLSGKACKYVLCGALSKVKNWYQNISMKIKDKEDSIS